MTEGIKAKFVAAWTACDNPELDSENPHFRNKYASLKATLKSVREACKPQGIAYIQKLTHTQVDSEGDPTSRELVSYVTDGSEIFELSRFPVACPANPQSFASNLTYAKRHQAQADWGITGEPDNDGETGDATRQKQSSTRRTAAPDSQTTNNKEKYLERCLQLKAQCLEQGIKESSLNSLYTAKFGDVEPNNLTLEQVTEWGHYLSQTIRKRSRHGNQ